MCRFFSPSYTLNSRSDWSVAGWVCVSDGRMASIVFASCRHSSMRNRIGRPRTFVFSNLSAHVCEYEFEVLINTEKHTERTFLTPVAFALIEIVFRAPISNRVSVFQQQCRPLVLAGTKTLPRHFCPSAQLISGNGVFFALRPED